MLRVASEAVTRDEVAVTDLRHHDNGGSTEDVSWEALADARQRLRLRVHRRRRRGRASALACTVLLVAIAHTGAEGLAARADLVAARTQLTRAVRALQAGNAHAALEGFTAAEAHGAAAQNRLASLPVRGLAAVPYLGRTVRTTEAVADGATLAAEAGARLAVAAVASDGLGALAPNHGRIPIDLLAASAPALTYAHDRVEQARRVVVQSPGAGVLAVVATARQELATELARVEPALRTAASLAEALPAFLGDDRPRRYFFAAQNPAELRGTGGFVGAYSIVTADGGKLDFGEFASIIDLSPTVVAGVRAPDSDYTARYAAYGGAGYGQNANMTPDVPTAGRAYMALYEASTGEGLDGAIFADPAALAHLLEVAGPVRVEGLGRVNKRTVVDQVANEAYAALPDSHARKALLGLVAANTVARFFEHSDDQPERAARALVEAARGGHLMLFAADADVQQHLQAAGVSGRFGVEEGDFLAVIGNNAAANKVDYYTRREVRHRVWLQPDGSARADTSVTLTNTAPGGGQVLDVIGPNTTYLRAGENRTILSVYCGLTCTHAESERSANARGAVAVEREFGHPVVTTIEQVAPGESVTVTHGFLISEAWSTAEGRYRLTFHNQPSIRPTHLEIDVHVPDGLFVLEGSSGIPVGSGVARWAGAPGPRQTFEILLGPPPPSAWQRVTGLLREPAITIGG